MQGPRPNHNDNNNNKKKTLSKCKKLIKMKSIHKKWTPVTWYYQTNFTWWLLLLLLLLLFPPTIQNDFEAIDSQSNPLEFKGSHKNRHSCKMNQYKLPVTRSNNPTNVGSKSEPRPALTWQKHLHSAYPDTSRRRRRGAMTTSFMTTLLVSTDLCLTNCSFSL